MNNSIFIGKCEEIGLNKAIALSAIKWYSFAIKQDADAVISLLYELYTFYDDALTVCKRLKMYALNRIERNKPITDIEIFKGIVDTIIEMNGNETKSDKVKETESIEELTENGWAKPFFDSHFEIFENYPILSRMVWFIRQHNIFNKWIDCDCFDTKISIGQHNSRQIKKDIQNMVESLNLKNVKITPSNFVKLCTIARYGYLVG